MHLRQPGFTYNACGPFTKNKERIEKFKETRDSRYIYENKLDIAYFQHDMTYGGFKELTRKTGSDKILHDKAFNIDKNPKYDGYQRRLASMIYKYFDKNISDGTVKYTIMSNAQLVEKLHKSIVRKIKKRKLRSSFIDNILGADLTDFQ